MGECYGKGYVFALNADSAVALVRTHYAFDDPVDSEYAVSDVWAKSTSDAGWQIREDKVEAYPIIVELMSANGLGHVNWTCPFCKAAYSDDWSEGESFPILLRCGCTDESRYLIGDVSK